MPKLVDHNPDEIIHRIKFGLPLSMAEQHWIAEMAFGVKITVCDKRCPNCNADGCSACGGTGYVREPG